MIKVGIIGATGYAGAEIVRILMRHPEAKIVWYGSQSYVDQSFASVYGNFFKIVDDVCKGDDMDRLAEEADVIFTATPQGFCASMVNEDILSKTKIIDLAADFRLKDVSVYEQWYKIKEARIVANPGCYTTCSILTAYPLVKEGLIDPNSLIIDAKSGTSGAGRSAKTQNLFCEVNENIKAYGVGTHRHTPEIEEQLGYAGGSPIHITFVPHLVPMNRGILVTAYASLKPGVSDSDIRTAYEKYYQNEYFIRLLAPGTTPETRWVEGSNFVDINYKVDARTGRVVLMGALDNLVKGAAGQAVQNMNLLFGLNEKTGIDFVPVFP